MIKLKKKWLPVAVIVVIVLIGAGVFYGMKLQGEKLAKQVADKTITFINENLLAQGTTASLVSILEENGIYKLTVKVGDQEPEVIAKGALYFFTSLAFCNKLFSIDDLVFL